MAIVKLSKNEQRRLSAFGTCLFLALLAWLFTALSGQQPFTFKAVVHFTNHPTVRSFRSLQPDTVEATIEGNGWDFLFSRMNMDNKNIDVDLGSLESKNYVVLHSQIKNINIKRGEVQPVTAFKPDTLYFDFSKRTVKQVPVELQYRLTIDHQFGISGHTQIKPNYVTIIGPEATVSTIKVCKTDSLIKNDVNDTVTANLPLQGVKASNLSFYPANVAVTMPVDEFTEKVLNIPVRLINNHNYYFVKLVPKTVRVIFTVALSHYAEINEHFFEAVADLDQWQNQGYRELPVKLVRYPAYCKIVRIEPQSLDFIIKK